MQAQRNLTIQRFTKTNSMGEREKSMHTQFALHSVDPNILCHLTRKSHID